MGTTLQKTHEHVEAPTRQVACKNCGNDFSENFCNRCGQREAHRITVPHVLHDLVHVFLHADKGIFPFIARVAHSPGLMAREFLEGKRKVFNPYQYLILSVGLIIFLMNQSHFYDSLESYNSGNASGQPAFVQQAIADLNQFLRKYTNVITFLSLPLLALSSWLMFRKKGNNYAEHVTVVAFSVSQVNTLNAVMLVFFMLFNIKGMFGSVATSFSLIIICLTITYWQLYRINIFKALMKGILVQVLAYAFQIVIMGACFVAYMFMLKARM